MSWNSSPDFWYLCGISEDAYIHVDRKNGNYEFDLDTISKDWLFIIQPIIKDLINKDVPIRKHTNRPHHRLRFWNKNLVIQLYSIKYNPEIILTINLDFQKQWIAGFFDAEGSATTMASNSPQLSFYSSNSQKISIIQKILKRISIKSGIYTPKNRNVQQLFLTSRGTVRKFFRLIHVRHPEKHKRIQSFFTT